MTVGDRIRNRRNDLGMSQQELANKIGYKTRGAINKIENGSRELTQNKLMIIAKALNTNPSYLMGWNTEKETTPSLLDEEIVSSFLNLTDEEKSKVKTYINSLSEERK